MSTTRPAQGEADRDGRVTKRSRRGNTGENEENTKKLQQIRNGQLLWILYVKKSKGTFVAQHRGEEVIGGKNYPIYQFMVKGYKTKLKEGDSADQLAVEGETLFTGYDAFWRKFEVDSEGNKVTGCGEKLIENAMINIEDFIAKRAVPGASFATATTTGGTPRAASSNGTSAVTPPSGIAHQGSHPTNATTSVATSTATPADFDVETVPPALKKPLQELANFYNTEANRQIASLSSENSELKARVHSIQNKTNSADKKIRKLAAENKTLRSKNLQLNANLKEEKDSHSATKQLARDLENELLSVKQKLAEVEAVREQDILRHAREIDRHKACQNGDENAKEEVNLRERIGSTALTTKPNVTWDDIAGLEKAKKTLCNTVIDRVKHPELFAGSDSSSYRGILLYGPPGTGKTFLAKAVATEANATFFSVTAADLTSKWHGESPKLVRTLFEMARESNVGRAVIFVDEIDALCSSRSQGDEDSSLRQIKTEFITQMDGITKGRGLVLVLGATNLPWEIDSAIRRRLEKRIFVPLPNQDARIKQIKLYIGDSANSLSKSDYDSLGELTSGASGSDLETMVKEAKDQCYERCKAATMFRPQDGFLVPCDNDPNCSHCPSNQSLVPPGMDHQCQSCGAIRMTLDAVPSGKKRRLDLEMKDFDAVLENGVISAVSTDELKRFEEWTEDFGANGN